jgi:hypothetical protein
MKILAPILFVSLSAAAQTEAPPVGEANSGQAMETQASKAREAVMKDAAGAIKKAKVFFIEPKDGATVQKTFKVKMGVSGIKVRPAGEAPDEMTSGHHHLLIDVEPAGAGVPVPADDKHIHFGKGQTETMVTLEPGEHTLTLEFADGAHRAFGKHLTKSIKVKVR